MHKPMTPELGKQCQTSKCRYGSRIYSGHPCYKGCNHQVAILKKVEIKLRKLTDEEREGAYYVFLTLVANEIGMLRTQELLKEAKDTILSEGKKSQKE